MLPNKIQIWISSYQHSCIKLKLAWIACFQDPVMILWKPSLMNHSCNSTDSWHLNHLSHVESIHIVQTWAWFTRFSVPVRPKNWYGEGLRSHGYGKNQADSSKTGSEIGPVQKSEPEIGKV